MPKIIEKSISILSDAGLGMAMFSLGECPSIFPFPSLSREIFTHYLSNHTFFYLKLGSISMQMEPVYINLRT